METHYYIGTNEYRTREAAVAKAREYANYDGEPVTVRVEKVKSTHYSRTKARVLGPSAPEVSYSEFQVSPSKRNPGKAGSAFKRCVKSVAARGGAYDPKAVCASAGRKKYGAKKFAAMAKAGKKRAKKTNPAAGAEQAFKEFHGYEPTEIVTVTEKVHHHKHLASAGDLVGFHVKPINGGNLRELRIPDALLAFNESLNQLFVKGGDQFLSAAELKKFGIASPHELETLGWIKEVGYFTDKKHLGKEGGEAVYSHTFRTTNQAGRHVTVRIARSPLLNYRVLDQQMEISGGSYEILPEGIDK